MGKGFLTGQFNEQAKFAEGDIRNVMPRFTPEALKANQVLIQLLSDFAAKRNATTAQIALAWVLAQKPWIVPIPGTTKLNRLQENLGAASIELTGQEISEIQIASEHIKIVGNRYNEQMEKSTGL